MRRWSGDYGSSGCGCYDGCTISVHHTGIATIVAAIVSGSLTMVRPIISVIAAVAAVVVASGVGASVGARAAVGRARGADRAVAGDDTAWSFQDNLAVAAGTGTGEREEREGGYQLTEQSVEKSRIANMLNPLPVRSCLRRSNKTLRAFRYHPPFI